MATAHLLTITLDDVEPPVWRRVQMPSDCTLAQAQQVLLTAMGWGGYHLSAIRIGDTTYMDLDDDLPEDSVDPASVRLGDVVTTGDRFDVDYDFGDGWGHQVVVEDIVPSVGNHRPRCLDGRRACPPEDVGGPWGYAELLEAIADPEHDRHDEMLEWVGGSFDATLFDPAEVNARLEALTDPA